MITRIGTDTADAILAWGADHSVATEQFLDGWDIEGVHWAAFRVFWGRGGGSLHTAVGDLVLTDTCLVISTAGANLSVDIWNG